MDATRPLRVEQRHEIIGHTLE